MATTILEQVLENVRAGALVPRRKEGPSQPMADGVLDEVAQSILKLLDRELDSFVQRSLSSAIAERFSGLDASTRDRVVARFRDIASAELAHPLLESPLPQTLTRRPALPAIVAPPPWVENVSTVAGVPVAPSLGTPLAAEIPLILDPGDIAKALSVFDDTDAGDPSDEGPERSATEEILFVFEDPSPAEDVKKPSAPHEPATEQLPLNSEILKQLGHHSRNTDRLSQRAASTEDGEDPRGRQADTSEQPKVPLDDIQKMIEFLK